MPPLFTTYKGHLIPESSPLLVILNTFPVECGRTHFMTVSDDDVTLQGEGPWKE